MELNDYIGLIVKINTSNGYYYTGKVISADDNSITLIDKNNHRVTLRENDILNISEVSR